MRAKRTLIAIAAGLGIAGSVAAADVSIKNNVLTPLKSINGDKIDVTVTGPKGFVFSTVKAGGDNTLSLGELNAMNDGLYKFEFTEIKSFGEEQVRDDFNGRGLSTRKVVESNKISGNFRIVKGQMVDSDLVEKSANTLNSNK